MTTKPPVAVKIARTKLVEQLTFHQQTISKGLCTPLWRQAGGAGHQEAPGCHCQGRPGSD
jgi:hypothetical protein